MKTAKQWVKELVPGMEPTPRQLRECRAIQQDARKDLIDKLAALRKKRKKP